MSKSLKRVTAALEAAGLPGRPVEMAVPTRTAAEAAAALGVEIDQIAKSILFVGQSSGGLCLFLTAGGRQVVPERASALAGEALGRADAGQVRALSGFAIGGVAPLGLIGPVRIWADPRLGAFAEVWAAAGTPRHVFPAEPGALIAACGAEIADFATG